MILDTTFLIDFHREIARRAPGGAAAFLQRVRDQSLHISVITMGEFVEGVAPDRFAAGCAFLDRFGLLLVDRAVSLAYAEASRELRTTGERIGDNDLWIAATALAHQMPLVSRNITHFGRVAHLHLLSY